MQDFKEFFELNETNEFQKNYVQSHFRQGHEHLKDAHAAGEKAEIYDHRGDHALAHIHHTIAAGHYAAAAHHFGESNNDEERTNASSGAAHHGEAAEYIHKTHGHSLY
jgi:hypothetical protein